MSSGRRHGPSRSMMLVMVTLPISSLRIHDPPSVSRSLPRKRERHGSEAQHIFFAASAEHQGVLHIFHSCEDKRQLVEGSWATRSAFRTRRAYSAAMGARHCFCATAVTRNSPI